MKKLMTSKSARALAFAACTFLAVAGPSLAEDAQPPQPAFKQMALTDKQIQEALATDAELTPILAKLDPNAQQPDPKITAQMNAVAKKHGYTDYPSYEAIAGNISLVLAGVNPKTKKYVGHAEVLKIDLADVKADKAMKPEDKKAAITEIESEMKDAKPLEFPGNVDVVMKYYDKLEALEQQQQQAPQAPPK